MNKRLLMTILSAFLSFSILTGCNGANEDAENDNNVVEEMDGEMNGEMNEGTELNEEEPLMDEEEADPTEEPSEQQQEEQDTGEQEANPTEEQEDQG